MVICKVIAWILVVNVCKSKVTRADDVFALESDLNVLHEDWKYLDNGFLDLSKSVAKTVFPHLENITSQLNITDLCNSSILRLMGDFRKGKLWAAKMVDATGKPAGGLLVGNFNWYGSHALCLSTSSPDRWSSDEKFRGKYCLIKFKPKLPAKRKKLYIRKPLEAFRNLTLSSEVTEEFLRLGPFLYSVSFQVGVCLPSVCTDDEVQQISSAIFQMIRFSNELVSCDTAEEIVLDWDQKSVLLTLLIFTTISTGVTILDVFDLFKTKAVWIILRVFSIRHNTEKVFNSENNSTNCTFSCLHGIKFLSICWVVLAHVYSLLDAALYREVSLAVKPISELCFQFVAGAILSVDSFVFISGVLMAYHIKKKGPKHFKTPVMIGRRLWRLLPSAMLTLGFVTILPLMSNGPMWKVLTGNLLNTTRKRWWAVLLCIGNFYNLKEIPVIHLWYIALDVQLFLMSLVIMTIYFRNKKLSYIVIIVIGVVSMIVSGVVVYLKDILPVEDALVSGEREIIKTIYFGHYLPQNHISVYLIGMAVGLFFANNPNVYISKWMARIAWILSLCLTFACVFSPSLIVQRPEIGPEINILFGCFHRTIWGVALAIMTILCSTGHGGIINSFLSWTPFFVLGRLTYLVYLLHVLFIVLIFGSATAGVDVKHNLHICTTIGVLGVSFIGAYVVKVIFEAPLEGLENLLLDFIFPKNPEMEEIKN